MGLRVLRIAPAWVRLVWSKDYVFDETQASAVAYLKKLPGVTLGGYTLDLPVSTWHLPEARGLMGIPTPVNTASTEWLPTTRTLYEHQQEAVRFGCSVSGLLLADDMGLGKTTSAAVIAERTRQIFDPQPVIIVSTLTARNVWVRELKALGITDRVHCLEGRDQTEGWDATAAWYFVHFDVALAWFSKLQQLRPCCVIVDEAHLAKNGRTQRARGVGAIMGIAPKRLALTGTPIETSPADTWNLLQLVCGPRTWGSPVDFRIRYCGATSDGYGYRDGEPTHVDELQLRASPCYLRRTKRDVALELPPLTRQMQLVELRRSMRSEHDSVLGAAGVAQLVEAIVQGQLTSNVLETLTRLRQVTSEGKLEATAEYVCNLQTQGEGVVVFAWEREIARRLAARIPGSFCVTGEDPQHRRDLVVDNFQATPGSVLVATLGTLRESVTLHTARIVVQHDLHWVLSHLLQAEARVWRGGQRRACQSVWMVADQSFDTVLLQALYAKALGMRALGIDEGMQALEELGVAARVRELGAARVDKWLEAWLQPSLQPNQKAGG